MIHTVIDKNDFSYDTAILFLELDLDTYLKEHINTIDMNDIIDSYNRFCENQHYYLELKYNVDTYYKLLSFKSDIDQLNYKLIKNIAENSANINDCSEQCIILMHGTLALLFDQLISAYRAQYQTKSTHVSY